MDDYVMSDGRTIKQFYCRHPLNDRQPDGSIKCHWCELVRTTKTERK